MNEPDVILACTQFTEREYACIAVKRSPDREAVDWQIRLRWVI